MTQKTYGVLHIHNSRWKDCQSFVSNHPGDCCQAPVVLKMAIPQQSSWFVLQLANESIPAVKRVFTTYLHVEPHSRVSIYVRYKIFEHKWCTFKGQGHSAQSLGRVGFRLDNCLVTRVISARCVQTLRAFLSTGVGVKFYERRI